MKVKSVDLIPNEGMKICFEDGEAVVRKSVIVTGRTRGQVLTEIRRRVIEAERDFAYMKGGEEALQELRESQPPFFASEMSEKQAEVVEQVLWMLDNLVVR